jgi:hypothetical protein
MGLSPMAINPLGRIPGAPRMIGKAPKFKLSVMRMIGLSGCLSLSIFSALCRASCCEGSDLQNICTKSWLKWSGPCRVFWRMGPLGEDLGVSSLDQEKLWNSEMIHAPS